MWTDSGNEPPPRDERRRAARYPMAVEFAFDGATGTTLNISAAGVYFTTTATVTVGACLVLELEARHFQMASPLAVWCRCRVVRVHHLEGHWGVAAAIDDVAFHRTGVDTGPGAPLPAQNTPLPLT